MRTDKLAMSRALPRYERDRQQQRMERAGRLERLSKQEPRFAVIDRALRMSGAAAVRAAVGGDPAGVEARIRQVAQENLALQDERAALLQGLGYPADYLNGGAVCPDCDDTGYTQEGMCACLRRFYREEQLRLLSEAALGQELGFSAFTREFFVDDVNQTGGAVYRRRREAYERCERFADEVSLRRGNLLLEGPSGCGKSLLALCIARRAIDKGLSVACVSAMDYTALCENERFRRDEDSGAALERFAGVDLLILDDLGSEPSGSYNNASFLSLLQRREQLSTVVCTGLDVDSPRSGLYSRYASPVASRLRGDFERLDLSGADLRGRPKLF